MSKPRVVAMLPARLGSKRIQHKNLRLLDGKPLVAHVAQACKKANIFSGIYINSEAEIFQKIAREIGVSFYKRHVSLASDNATNDAFILDFVENVDCDIVVQINPTSPLVQPEEIKAFVDKMLSKDYDTMLSFKKEQVEGIYKGKPINFDPMKQMPRSQDLEPIYLHCSTILAWKKSIIMENMKKYGCTTYGADSKIGMFIFSGFSTIDIDNEDDFLLAELALSFLNSVKSTSPSYYQG